MVGLELGSFQHVVDYARSIAESYRSTIGPGWETRFWSERLLLPWACGDLEAEAVPPEWVMPSWRIAQPWTVWRSSETDAALRRNLSHEARSPAETGSLTKAPPHQTRHRTVSDVLEMARDLMEGGNATEARPLLDELLRVYPWADLVWWRLAEIARRQGDSQEAIRCVSAALVLRPHERALWQCLCLILHESHNTVEARIAAIVSERMPDELPKGYA